MRTFGSLVLVGTLAASGPFDTVRANAQSGPPKVSAMPVLDDPAGTVRTLPAGAELDLVLQTPLNAGTILVDGRFEAVTIATVAPRGPGLTLSPATARGFVSSVRPAGQGRSSLTVSFDELRAGANVQRLRASVVQVFEGQKADEGSRRGAGGSAVAGGIPDGTRAALAGVLMGVGGTIIATDGRNVELPAGTILRIRLDQPVEIRVGGL